MTTKRAYAHQQLDAYLDGTGYVSRLWLAIDAAFDEAHACDYVEQRPATWTQPAEAYGCELPAIRGGRCARHADTPEREREHDDD